MEYVRVLVGEPLEGDLDGKVLEFTGEEVARWHVAEGAVLTLYHCGWRGDEDVYRMHVARPGKVCELLPAPEVDPDTSEETYGFLTPRQAAVYFPDAALFPGAFPEEDID
jgi:hypothetical protein